MPGVHTCGSLLGDVPLRLLSSLGQASIFMLNTDPVLEGFINTCTENTADKHANGSQPHPPRCPCPSIEVLWTLPGVGSSWVLEPSTVGRCHMARRQCIYRNTVSSPLARPQALRPAPPGHSCFGKSDRPAFDGDVPTNLNN